VLTNVTDGRTDGRTSSDPMTATLLKHVAVKMKFKKYGENYRVHRQYNRCNRYLKTYSVLLK